MSVIGFWSNWWRVQPFSFIHRPASSHETEHESSGGSDGGDDVEAGEDNLRLVAVASTVAAPRGEMFAVLVQQVVANLPNLHQCIAHNFVRWKRPEGKTNRNESY